MQHFISQIFNTSRYTGLIDKDRARIVYSISAIIIAVTTLFALTYRLPDTGESIWQRAASDPSYILLMLTVYILSTASILLTRSGRLNLSAAAIVVMWFLTFGLGTAALGMYSAPAGMVVFIIVLLSGLLLGVRGLAVGIALAVVILLIGIAVRASVPRPETTNNISELFSSLVILLMFAGIVYLYLRFSRLSKEEGLSEALEQRLRLAEITTQITQRISSRSSLNDLLKNSVEQIVQSYPEIYHAQIFLNDPGEHRARLQASTGEAGQILLARQHSLGIGSQSVIGRVTALGTNVVARAGARDGVHQRNELLPETAVEAAFPLMSGTTVIGALDLQSRDPEAFQPRDLPMFQTLTDHIAVAIDNTRLFEQTQERLEENKRLVEQSRVSLLEVERLNQRLTGRAWSEYFSNARNEIGVSVDFTQNRFSPFEEWTTGLESAIEQGQIVQHDHAGYRIIAVPIVVRGQVVGAMEFELNENNRPAPEDLELIQQVSERAGLAIENARLYEQSQRAAQQEALLNEIAARLQTSNNVEATLSEAARSLHRALNANKVAIRLGAAPVKNGSLESNEQ